MWTSFDNLRERVMVSRPHKFIVGHIRLPVRLLHELVFQVIVSDVLLHREDRLLVGNQNEQELVAVDSFLHGQIFQPLCCYGRLQVVVLFSTPSQFQLRKSLCCQRLNIFSLIWALDRDSEL